MIKELGLSFIGILSLLLPGLRLNIELGPAIKAPPNVQTAFYEKTFGWDLVDQATQDFLQKQWHASKK